MMKKIVLWVLLLAIVQACDWQQETAYTTKYHYFLTKRDLVNDSLVKELCNGPWKIFQLEHRKFNKQKIAFDDSRTYLVDSNLFEINFLPDSTISTKNPSGKGTWSIANKYFIEFDFFGSDTANHLRGKFDVKMRYNDLLFNQGVYTSDTSSETLRIHFFRQGGIQVN